MGVLIVSVSAKMHEWQRKSKDTIAAEVRMKIIPMPGFDPKVST